MGSSANCISQSFKGKPGEQDFLALENCQMAIFYMKELLPSQKLQYQDLLGVFFSLPRKCCKKVAFNQISKTAHNEIMYNKWERK